MDVIHLDFPATPFTHEGELKVLQYFVGMSHNSTGLDAFVVIGKVTNYIGLWFGLFGFMAYQLLSVIYRQIHFYVNNQFYLKQFSLA